MPGHVNSSLHFCVIFGVQGDSVLMRRLLLSSIVLALVLSFSSRTWAQAVSTLTGIVSDLTGAVIPGANVELVNTSTNATLHATTNSLGSYTFANVPPGPGYKITISANGFEPYQIVDVY